jgi:fused signal recognition particle receptor
MWSRVKNNLKSVLSRTAGGMQQGWASLFQAQSWKDVDWDALEETLLLADVGMDAAEKLLDAVRAYKGDMGPGIRAHLIQHTTTVMKPFEGTLHPGPVVLFVGVNGSGKTTTLGKLAALWGDQGHRVHIIAGDTFRAGATEQLGLWAKDFPMTTGQGDPASVVYKGLMAAQEHNDDVVLIDTAGRLPNQVGLMDQMKKLYGVIQKLRPEQGCQVVLTLDATVGQHALVQIENFQKCVPVTGLIMNKMDGTAKGGILIQACHRYGLPIYGLGVGESASDWRPFIASDYADALWSTPKTAGDDA